MSLEITNAYKSFDGWTKRYVHHSEALDCAMRFTIYLPPQISNGQKSPVIYWLSGLTCSDENFMQKAGAQRIAAQLGVAIVAPDTSPRGDAVADAEGYDLGQGAGFYVNATQVPWDRHYKMYDYVLKELPALIEAHFPISGERSIMGHSMGGHGALILALRNPSHFQSVSAFSPISNPMNCPWGKKALTTYLGDDLDSWFDYDASVLMRKATQFVPTLVDQGEDDQFLEEQLQPKQLEAAAKASGYPLEINYRKGYDHSYFFIASFVDDHVRFHAKHLTAKNR